MAAATRRESGQYFSRENILPPIPKEKEDDVHDEFAISSKLTNIEAQRIMAVIQEMQKKVHVVNVLSENMDKKVTSVLPTDTFTLMKDHVALETKYKQLSEGKSDQKDIREVSSQIKTSIRTLLRHFLQNPSTMSKLRYLKQSHVPVIANFEHRLQECKMAIYDKLKTTVEEEAAKQEQLAIIIAKEQKTSGEVKALREELEKAKKERMGEINKKNEIIRKLKDELREIKHQAEDSIKKLETKSKQKEDGDIQVFKQKEQELNNEILELKKQLDQTVTRNRDEEANARKKKFKIESEVENWIHKYDQDMDEKQAEIDDLTTIYNEEKAHLDELLTRYTDLQKEYDAVLLGREKQAMLKKEQQLLEEKKNYAATKIQAAWKGFRLRKELKSKNEKAKKDKKGKKK